MEELHTINQQIRELQARKRQILNSHIDIDGVLKRHDINQATISNYTTKELKEITGLSPQLLRDYVEARGYYKHRTSIRMNGKIVTVYKYKLIL